jgi:hypothetical protein
MGPQLESIHLGLRRPLRIALFHLTGENAVEIILFLGVGVACLAALCALVGLTVATGL